MSNPYRLPRTVVPSRYELTVAPDLAALTFEGTESISVEVIETTDQIVLNAVDLDITGAAFADASGRRVPATVTFDEETERAFLHLDGPVEPGFGTVEISFAGRLRDDLVGFYRSVYTDDEGVERVIAATQFEATDARRAFPCWDEPDLKAVFAVTLVVDEDLLAVSNMTEAGRRTLGDGRVEVRFADSIRMSTYLVAFVVGPLEAGEPVDVDGLPLRVIYPPGRGHLTALALDVGAFCLRYLSQYYAVPYPGDKVDFIAIPDFAFGAMENLGAITYRESALLVDPAGASQSEQIRVAGTVAHELAHMWFGDLVTMRWWDGIWLNEAFATFMELKAIDAYRPEWRRWLSWAGGASTGSRAMSLDEDALETSRPVEFEVVKPSDAEQMFDTLTYGKGSAVLRMLEQFVGEEAFRAGIRRYLAAHAYANTVTEDLWAALGAETDIDVAGMMDTWIRQAGFPSLEVRRSNAEVTVRQKRFTYLGTARPSEWRVPVRFTGGSAGEVRVGAEIAAPGLEIELAGADPWFNANAGGHGFYRVLYDAELFAGLVARLDQLDPLERFTLVEDTWAFVRAGWLPVREFLELTRRYEAESEYAVWATITNGFAELHRIVPEVVVPALRAFIGDRLTPTLDSLGWTPGQGEDEVSSRVRGTMILGLGRLAKDEAVVGRCRDLFERLLAGEPIEPEVGQAVTSVVAAHGDDAEFDRFVSLYEQAPTPQLEMRYLMALPAFPDPDVMPRIFDMALEGRVRASNAPFLLARALLNETGNGLAWQLMKDHWEELMGRFPPFLGRHLIDYVDALSEPEAAADVEAFFAEREIPHADQVLPRQLERLRVAAAVRRDQHGPLVEYFSGR